MSNRLVQKAPAETAFRMLARVDTHHFEDHLLRLTNHCRRLRFGGEITDRFLQDYARNVDFTNTVVLGAFVNGVMVAAAELRSFQTKWCGKAEAAFSVEVANRACGVGTKLMHGLLAAARKLEVTEIYLTLHPANHAMRRIVEAVQGGFRREGQDLEGRVMVRKEPLLTLSTLLETELEMVSMAILSD